LVGSGSNRTISVAASHAEVRCDHRDIGAAVSDEAGAVHKPDRVRATVILTENVGLVVMIEVRDAFNVPIVSRVRHSAPSE
jgi:hypothetical protein